MPHKPIPRITNRKKKLASLMLVNVGKPEGELMRLAGYSPSYARYPLRLKRTLSWEEIMDKCIPDIPLLLKHAELLDSPDPIIRFKALELAYKIKGRLIVSPVDSHKEQATKEMEETLERVRRILPE